MLQDQALRIRETGKYALVWYELRGRMDAHLQCLTREILRATVYAPGTPIVPRAVCDYLHDSFRAIVAIDGDRLILFPRFGKRQRQLRVNIVLT